MTAKNAIKRYLARLKRDHHRLKLIILLDGLYADNPTIALIRKYGWHYINVAKDENHEALIEAVNNLYDQAEVHHHEIIDEETKATHQFRFANNVPLNLQNQTEMVNVLDYIEFGKDGHILRYWSWVTDIELTNETVKDVMIGGRTRWSIENESFNTLKNKGYHLEHNYGHGKKNLATNFACLIILTFLVDQVLSSLKFAFEAALPQALGCGKENIRFQSSIYLEMSNPEYQKALKKQIKETRIYLWDEIREFTKTLLFDSWDELFHAIIHGIKPMRVEFDSS